MDERSIYHRLDSNRVKSHDFASRNNEITYKEDGIFPYEKWLVAYKNNFSKRFSERIILRQFYAAGFYEAFDVVATYAERFQVEILWFLEKRECGLPYVSSNYPGLEIACTYCDNLIDYQDSVPCPKQQCSAKVCSRKCLMEHIDYKHN